MHRLLLISLFTCMLGCDSSSPPQPPAARPATTNTTRPAFKPVELQYGLHLARLEIRTTITADGILRSVRTENKSHGGNDIDPKDQRIEIREGRVSAEQLAELVRLFDGWDALSSQPYGGVPDGGHVSIRYGDKTVSGGSGVPKRVADIQVRISDLAAAMPVVSQ